MTYQFEKSGKLKTPTTAELAAADEHSSIIVLDRGTVEDGRPYWAYIAVKPSRYGAFMRASAAHETIQLSDYGQVLKWGMDEEVPADIRGIMQREHGFDEKYMSRLAEEVKQAQAEFLQTQDDARINDIVSMLKQKLPNGVPAAPPVPGNTILPGNTMTTAVSQQPAVSQKIKTTTGNPQKSQQKPKPLLARLLGKR